VDSKSQQNFLIEHMLYVEKAKPMSLQSRKKPVFRSISMPSVRSLKECGYHRTPHVEASRKRSESTQQREEAGQEVERKYLVLTTLLSKLLEATAGGALDGLKSHGPANETIS
jgi:hypothetical protein